MMDDLMLPDAVAWRDDDGNLCRDKPHEDYGPEPTPLYTAGRVREAIKQAVEAERARVAPLLDKLEGIIQSLD